MLLRNLFISMALAVGLTSYSGAIIEWDHEEHDFGAFNESVGAPTALFTFYNRGTDTLVVTGSRANCGCTTPALSATVVAPGDSATLSVTYDPEGRPGRFEKRVYVDTNTEPKRSVLKIKGVVVGSPASINARYPVEVGPLRLTHSAALLGIIHKGHVKSIFEAGYNASTDTISPIVTDTPKWLDVKPFTPKTGPGEGVSFNFFIDSSKIDDWDLITDTVTVRPFAGSPDSYRMPVVITVEEDFTKMTDSDLANSPTLSVTPEKFEPVVIDKPVVNITAEISNTGTGVPLKIRRMYTVTPGVKFSLKKDVSIKAGKTQKVNISFTGADLPPKVSTVIVTIITNDPLSPKKTLRIPVFNKLK